MKRHGLTRFGQHMARRRIRKLLGLAHERVRYEPELSRRYMQLVRRLSMKYKVRPDQCEKKRFCKGCDTYLLPGLTCRVRTKGGKVVYTCLHCGRYIRHPFYRERKMRRQKGSGHRPAS